MVLLALLGAVTGCARRAAETVVVYCALDRVYSEPIFRRFEEQTGIRPLCVYDAEAVKTTGLVNRLLAEKASPQADVFWNNEVCQTIRLKEAAVLEPFRSQYCDSVPPAYRDAEGFWCGFAARARVLIYNRDLVTAAEAPTSIFDLAKAKWKGKAGIAYPIFGTTYTHFGALFTVLGEKPTLTLIRDLIENDVHWVDGNATVKSMVASGELLVGLTDTDDANGALEDGRPVEIVFPDSDGIGTLVLPNSVALIKGAPHPANARKLIDFLLSPAVEGALAASRSAQMPLRDLPLPNRRIPALAEVRQMQVAFEEVAACLPRVSAAVRSLGIALGH